MIKGGWSAAVVAVGWAWASASAVGGTIRHDVSDSLYLARAAQSQYAPVGKVTSSGLLASGTLIADDWVLTAAHVVDAASSTLSFTLGSQSYTSTEWVTYSGWDGVWARAKTWLSSTFHNP
jgi:hypothetical protein